MKGNHDNLSRILAGMMLLLVSTTGLAEIYKWTDAEGRVYFTDQPPESANSQTVKLQINSFTSPTVEKFEFDDSLITKRKVSADVVMYSTTWCGYCKKARKYFQQNKIPFAEYEVEKSEKGKRDYKSMNGRGVPIILVGDKRMNGFSPGAFDQIYRQ